MPHTTQDDSPPQSPALERLVWPFPNLYPEPSGYHDDYHPDHPNLTTRMRWLQGHADSFVVWIRQVIEQHGNEGAQQEDWQPLPDNLGPVRDYGILPQGGDWEPSPIWRLARERMMEALQRWADVREDSEGAREMAGYCWEDAQFHLDVLHSEVYRLRSLVENTRRALNFLDPLAPPWYAQGAHQDWRRTLRPRTPWYYPHLHQVLDNMADNSIVPSLRPDAQSDSGPAEGGPIMVLVQRPPTSSSGTSPIVPADSGAVGYPVIPDGSSDDSDSEDDIGQENVSGYIVIENIPEGSDLEDGSYEHIGFPMVGTLRSEQ